MPPRISAHTAMAASAAGTLRFQTGEPTAAKAAAMPNTGRKVAARWPSVPQTHATIMYLRCGPTSLSKRAITRAVGIAFASDSAESDIRTPVFAPCASVSAESDIRDVVSARCVTDSGESDN